MAHFKYFAVANDDESVAGPVRLCGVVVGTGAASAVFTIYNGTSTSDPVVAAFDGTVENTYEFHGVILSNLYAKLTGGNALVTLIYE
jgi:hypothetical protein